MNDLLLSHTMLMEEILVNTGSYRTKNVGVGSEHGVVHVAPPPGQVQDLMKQLFSWLENSSIHPFIDGNGRIGRLWQSLILYKWKSIFSAIPIESVIKETQQEYYNALENSGNIGESTPFIEFMLESILKACENETKRNQKVPKNVPLKRLDNILEFIRKDKTTTISQLAEILKVSDKTIKRDISKLKDENKLKRVGSLKAGHWEIK